MDDPRYEPEYGAYGAYRDGGAPYDGADWAEVRVLVAPSEAEVRVDGDYAGVANDFDGSVQRLRLSPGRHEVELSLPGYLTERLTVDLAPGARVRLQRALRPDRAVDANPSAWDDRAGPAIGRGIARRGRQAGTLRLSVEPPDAAVYVDGQIAGDARNTRTLTLAPGTHSLEAVRPGFRAASRTIEIACGRTTSVQLELVPNR